VVPVSDRVGWLASQARRRGAITPNSGLRACALRVAFGTGMAVVIDLADALEPTADGRI
jgi:hypothetical protein